jgi:hypothetical protein
VRYHFGGEWLNAFECTCLSLFSCSSFHSHCQPDLNDCYSARDDPKRRLVNLLNAGKYSLAIGVIIMGALHPHAASLFSHGHPFRVSWYACMPHGSPLLVVTQYITMIDATVQ